MTYIEDQTFENTTVAMDDKYFLRCTFSNCTVIYSGGDFGWNDCTFGVNVYNFQGAADRTINFLRASNLKVEEIKQGLK